MFFPLLESFDHVVSVLIDFPLNPKEDAPFYCIAYDYSLADCDGLCDYLRDVLWEAIFKLSASGGFRLELMYISCIVNIRSSLNHFHVFTEITFICLYQENKSSEFKVKFRQANNHCKCVLEDGKLAYANKTKESIPSQKCG